MQLVGIDIERAPGGGTIGLGHDGAHPMLECLARVQAAHGIKAALDYACGLAREHVGETRVAVAKLLGGRIAEQCKYTGRAAARVPERAGQNAIRPGTGCAAWRELIDDDGLAAYLRH